MDRARTRRRLSTRERARRIRLVGAVAISLAGALAAVWADGAATGVDGIDAGYRALYGLGVGLACATARRWTWPLLAGGALLGGPPGAWFALAALALGLAFGSQFDRRRRQPVGALIGVLSAQALLRLPPAIEFGVPSAIAFAAPLPAVVSALVAARRRSRRVVLWSAAMVASGAMALTILLGVGLVLTRADARSGVDAARAGLQHLRAGDEQIAATSFRAAASAFADANRLTEAWWMRPASVVPVASQHLYTARSLTKEGRRLAAISAATAPAVTLDDLSSGDGRFRLDRIKQLEPIAQEMVTALTTSERALAGVSDDWLTEPMSDALRELEAEIDSSLPDARLALHTLTAAPELLGATDRRNYVVLFGNPAEAREMGGFVASIGLLTADDGRLGFESLDSPAALEARLDPSVELTTDVPPAYAAAQPDRYVRNWTDSPDIATVNRSVAELFPLVDSGTQVDGVLYLDPYALAGLLELTGPVTIPETSTVLSDENVVDFMLRDQYLADDFDRGGERKERLGEAGEVAFDRLISRRLPRPRRLAAVFSPLVQARRLLFSTTDPTSHDLLERTGLRPVIDAGADETVLVAHGKRRPNKLDAYLRRTIDYRAEVAADGSTTATLAVELTNTAPTSGLVEYQTGRQDPDDPDPAPVNALTLDLYSALDEVRVLVDGKPSPRNTARAYGLNQYSVPVVVPAGTTVVVELHLRGTVDPARCRFEFVPNASARSDTMRATVRVPGSTIALGQRALTERTVMACDR